jgi:DUF917 family protein
MLETKTDVPAMTNTRRLLISSFLLGASACGSGGGGNEVAADNMAENLAAEAPEDAALLAQDPELANEAAADEAADMDEYGGNAAAMPPGSH